jgi:pyroglutamyl-peptidase
MRLLLTGFEPFGEHRVNPSALLAERLGGVVLPVSAARMPGELEAVIDEAHPDVVLGLGLASLRTQVAVERVAINCLDFSLPDNDGVLAEGQEILPGGPAAYFATAPVRMIAAAWQAEEIPSYLSNSAGTYICNQMLYTACRLGAERGFKAGFIHLPPLEHVDLDRQLQAVELALAVVEGRLDPVPA